MASVALIYRLHVPMLFILLGTCKCKSHDSKPSADRTEDTTSTDSFDLLKLTGSPQSDNLTSLVTLHLSSSPQLRMGFHDTLYFNYTIYCVDQNQQFVLDISSADVRVADLDVHHVYFYCINATEEISKKNETDVSNVARPQITSLMTLQVLKGTLSIVAYAELIGRTKLFFHLRNASDASLNLASLMELAKNEGHLRHQNIVVFKVVVVRQLRPVDFIFRAIIYIFIIGTTISFGAKLDLAIVKETLKKPIAPVIGFCCQYLIMPLLAFGIAKIVTKHDISVSLGIFVAGCCPGGGASNIYSYLLGGDLSLSITMTTISTIGALAMLPMWIYSLGSLLRTDDVQINIPFLNIFTALLTIVLPLFVGVFIRFKLPRFAKLIIKIMKPVMVVAIALLITVGIYSNLFIFKMFNPRIVLAGCLLPYFGYILGGLVSFICRQPWTRIKTIAIETGLQNIGIAILLMVNSFPAPDGDIAAVAPIASAVMTPLPLFVITITYLIYQRCTRDKYRGVPTSQNEKGGGKENNKMQSKNTKSGFIKGKWSKSKRENNGVIAVNDEEHDEDVLEKISTV